METNEHSIHALTQGEHHIHLRLEPWISMSLRLMSGGHLLKFPIKSVHSMLKQFFILHVFSWQWDSNFVTSKLPKQRLNFYIEHNHYNLMWREAKTEKMPLKYRKYLAVCRKQQSSPLKIWFSFLLTAAKFIVRGQLCIVHYDNWFYSFLRT